jgi:hypothetical protein
MPPSIRTVETDSEGMFDFGPLSTGHYTLTIGEEDSFDVEIRSPQTATETVIVDVSPVTPDCKGGHEFIVKTKR